MSRRELKRVLIVLALSALIGESLLREARADNLLVTDRVTDRVLSYDTNGGSVTALVGPNAYLSGPTSAVIGFGGDLFVTSINFGMVLRFDRNTGAMKDVFASGLYGPNSLAYDAASNTMFVGNIGNFDSNEIVRFDANKNVVQTITAGPAGGRGGLKFGPDGNLYATNFLGAGGYFSDDGSVLKYTRSSNFTTATTLVSGDGNPGNSTYLSGPNNIAFVPTGVGSDSTMYVASLFGQQVAKYSVQNGAVVGSDSSFGSFFNVPPTAYPYDIMLGPDNKLWVSTLGNNNDLDPFYGQSNPFAPNPQPQFQGNIQKFNLDGSFAGTQPFIANGDALNTTNGFQPASMLIAANTVTWTGTTDGVWDINNKTNWNAGGPATVYTEGEQVVFDDSGANTSPITINSDVHPGSMTVNNSTTPYALSGTAGIAGSTGLVKRGSGTLSIANSNSYTGNTVFESGMIVVQASNALGSGASTIQMGALSGSDSATLSIQAGVTIDRDITLRAGSSGSAKFLVSDASGTSTLSGTVTLEKSLTVQTEGTSILDLTGPLNNVAGQTIVKTGTGDLQLKGDAVHGSGALLNVQAGRVIAFNNAVTEPLSSNLGVQLAEGTTLDVRGTAASTVSSVRGLSGGLGALTIGSGDKLQLAADSGQNSIVRSLNISGAATPVAKLDINDNSLLIDYTGSTPFNTVQAQVVSGYAGGGWNGNGINSAVAATDPGTYGVGYAENSDLGLGVYSDPQSGNDPVDFTTIIVKATYLGDADLDGDVDGDDYVDLLANFGATSGANWFMGDFDYNGTVDGDDYVQLLANFGDTGLGGIGGLGGGGITPVPEPSTLLLSGVAAVVLLGAAVHRRRPGG